MIVRLELGHWVMVGLELGYWVMVGLELGHWVIVGLQSITSRMELNFFLSIYGTTIRSKYKTIISSLKVPPVWYSVRTS